MIGVGERLACCSSPLSLPAIFGFDVLLDTALGFGREPTVNGSSELPAADRAAVVVVYPDEYHSSVSRGGEMTLFLEGVKSDTNVLFYFISSHEAQFQVTHMFKSRISLLSHL